MVNEWMASAQAYLAQRGARERRVLAGGAVLLLLLVGYGGVYEPMRQAKARLEAALPSQRAELRLMRAQATEIERLRGNVTVGGEARLEQRIKSSAAAFGLGEAFTRFTALAENQYQLSTQALPNNAWTEWLGDLERQGVTVTRCRISAEGDAGQASLDLLLSGRRQ